VSALDVSVPAPVINLLRDLQRGANLANLLISHDLAVVEHVSRRIAVLDLGKVAELTAKRTPFSAPLPPSIEAPRAAILRGDGGSCLFREARSLLRDPELRLQRHAEVA
jgi:ABC-type oligopeptide transport system ATPase subunit